MTMGPIESRFNAVAEERGAGLCILLDPDRHDLSELTKAAEVCETGGADFLLEQRAIATKGDLFEDIYGVKVRLEPV